VLLSFHAESLKTADHLRFFILLVFIRQEHGHGILQILTERMRILRTTEEENRSVVKN
jgi:hypothetical protein